MNNPENANHPENANNPNDANNANNAVNHADHAINGINGNDSDDGKNGRQQEGYVRKWPHSLLCGIAVVTRCLGKMVAIFNAMWIIISTIFEYIGLYDNCWCKADALSLGENGWLTLFKVASKSIFLKARLLQSGSEVLLKPLQ